MKFCYADPPYPGQAKRYAHDPRHAEVDPVELMLWLEREYPDGWAMSTSSPALRVIAPAMPERARIAAWGKTFANMKPNVYPCYAWEPVILRTAQFASEGNAVQRDRRTPYDWMQSMPTMRNFMGAKPSEFCFWIFDMLGARQGDELVDLFPGTGAVSQAWEFYQRTIAPPQECILAVPVPDLFVEAR